MTTDNATTSQGSFEYRLERTPMGVVVLDLGRRITAVNEAARRLLKQGGHSAIGADILSVHPASARTKVRWLIDAAENAHDGTASMVVTTPMGSLVTKVTMLGDQGFCMIFHAVGGMAMGEDGQSERPRLLKLPVLRGGKTELIDIADVLCLVAQGHYAEAVTLSGACLCPLSLAELERRIDSTVFVRVHRRYLVNLHRIAAARRQEGRWILVLSDAAATCVPVGRDKVGLVRRLLAV